MRIQQNMPAINTNRFLGANQKLICKNAEKLSSGYRINRASDDAAGLSISEKMRNQIRGLNQATKNIEDGISLIQTAEGALNETHSILARMRELAVQAANDTYDTEDRAMIQAEIDQLTEEIDDIAYKTQFNDGIRPLLGVGDSRSQMMRCLTEITATVTAPAPVTYAGIAYQRGEKFTVTGVYVQDYTNPNSQGCLFIKGASFGNTKDRNKFKDIIELNIANNAVRNPGYDFGSDMKIAGFGVDEEGRIYSLEYGYKTYYYTGTNSDGSKSILRWPSDLNDPNILKVNTKEDSSSLWIQSGANAGEGLNLSLVNATAAAIGINGISVMSNAEAGNAIQSVDRAVKKVSEYRSAFGAQQNRLERAMEANLNYSENLQGSESKIRDTDMAGEMSAYLKQNILLQAGQAILTQANRNPQAVLSLLQ